jgi:two-component system chemotaxis response regulator CheY
LLVERNDEGHNVDTTLSVLVVDDSQTVSLVITRHLQKLGFSDIDLAQDGHSALDCVRRKSYGLIISDWEMQPMGGEEFVKLLRQDHRYSNVPVILITAKAGRGASWLVGADAYLAKPFNEREFEAALKSVFRVLT